MTFSTLPISLLFAPQITERTEKNNILVHHFEQTVLGKMSLGNTA
jgi:hypothetical protein